MQSELLFNTGLRFVNKVKGSVISIVDKIHMLNEK